MNKQFSLSGTMRVLLLSAGLLVSTSSAHADHISDCGESHSRVTDAIEETYISDAADCALIRNGLEQFRCYLTASTNYTGSLSIEWEFFNTCMQSAVSECRMECPPAADPSDPDDMEVLAACVRGCDDRAAVYGW